MTDTSSNAVIDAGYRNSELNPLLIYEAQVVGNELRAYVPRGDERRETASRQNKTILKTWRGVPTERNFQTSQTLRQGLSSMKTLESQKVVDSERMFLVVLSAMTILLGSLFAFLVFQFCF